MYCVNWINLQGLHGVVPSSLCRAFYLQKLASICFCDLLNSVSFCFCNLFNLILVYFRRNKYSRMDYGEGDRRLRKSGKSIIVSTTYLFLVINLQRCIYHEYHDIMPYHKNDTWNTSLHQKLLVLSPFLVKTCSG